MRFDEVELAPVIFDVEEEAPEPGPTLSPAPRIKRLLALLTDLSLFVALALALSPLLPAAMTLTAVAALGAFVVLVSYYYFVCCWLFWGKTIGGAIFDVRVIAIGATAMPLKSASQRWAGVYLSLASGGLGFALAGL